MNPTHCSQKRVPLVSSMLLAAIAAATAPAALIEFETPASADVGVALIIDGVAFTAGADYGGLDFGALVVIPSSHPAFGFGLPSNGTGVLWSPRHDLTVGLTGGGQFTLTAVDVGLRAGGTVSIEGFLNGLSQGTISTGLSGYSTLSGSAWGAIDEFVVTGTALYGGDFTIDNLSIGTAVPDSGPPLALVVLVLAGAVRFRRTPRILRDCR